MPCVPLGVELSAGLGNLVTVKQQRTWSCEPSYSVFAEAASFHPSSLLRHDTCRGRLVAESQSP